MKPNIKTLLTLLLVFCSLTLFAQAQKTKADTLIMAGTALHDAQKYAEAIAKYDEALTLEPNNVAAQFEKAFSLTSWGKPDEALPLLEKVAATKKLPGAYDVLGTIYDNKGDFATAMKYYNEGITAFPQYFMLHYNLAICCMKQKKYAEAEKAAIDAIKLNPRHASSHRVYAMAEFGEGNQSASLLGWCSFLLIEPQTPRSAEGIKFVKTILYNGVSNGTGKNVTLNISDKDPANLTIKLAVIAATVNKTGLSSVDSLQLQLSAVIKVLHEQKDKLGSAFCSKYLADYFNAMATSPNMATFTHFITMTTNRDENIVWFKTHPTEIKDFSTWLGSTKREME